MTATDGLDLFHHSGVAVAERRLRGCVPLDRVAAALRDQGEEYGTLAVAVRRPGSRAARASLARTLGHATFRTNTWLLFAGDAQPGHLERLHPWLAFVSLWRVRRRTR